MQFIWYFSKRLNVMCLRSSLWIITLQPFCNRAAIVIIFGNHSVDIVSCMRD
uniref:Uncharacterized protein n=1 Tax=Arundo donax TaxID=35708 RepID=A0A0A8ZT01_ARUDO